MENKLRVAVAIAFLYQNAEEEAAERRRQIIKRRVRIQRRTAKRRAILACLSSFVRFCNYYILHLNYSFVFTL